MAKSLRKVIMLKSWLKSKSINNKSEEKCKTYKQQTNYCVKPLRNTIKCYIFKTGTLIRSMITMFWKTAKPRSSNKCKTENTIILTERSSILKNDKLIADTFNNYFADIAKTLKLKKHPINKASLIEDIPIKILKNSIHIYSKKLTHIFNECFIEGKFHGTLEIVDVTPIF